MKTYIKKDLIDRVAEQTGVRLVDSSRMVDALFQVLRDVMSEPGPDCRIEIRDFGVFEVKQTRAKPNARNPRTNELVYVPARRKTHFRPGKHLKEALRRLREDESQPEGQAPKEPDPVVHQLPATQPISRELMADG
ncbi:MAG: HU family DNA-binding protein [bacterium]|jgi:integration host factor subunit beta|nr:HU family DNA-binding protein [bacterium]